MRLALLWGVLGLLCAPAIAEAQGPSSDALRQNYQRKLEKPFVGKIEWVRTREEAKERARAEGKPILGYFTRSYAP